MTHTLDQTIAQLPFDTESMLARLKPWIECESPSYDPAAVDTMMQLVARELEAMGEHAERIEGRGGMAGCVRVRLRHPCVDHDADVPGILIMGHLDTVHPRGTLGALPWKREAGRVYGPGILDMKGGLFIALEALSQLRAARIDTALPVTLLFTSDEEIGSPSTRALIEAEARKHRYVLIPEPARPDGGVVVGRHAIIRLRLRATGTPSHAGSRLADGRSAIRVMAEKLIELENATCEQYTFSVGVIHGGQWVNCVPRDCTAEALVMAKSEDDAARAIAIAQALAFSNEMASFTVEVGETRPIWRTSDGTRALYELARGQAEALGFALPHQVSGGGSDGNFTGALGLTTLDGLGLRGNGMHTLHEHIEEDSLAERGRLIAGLLARLA